MIESHFWIEIPLKLDNQIIQIKSLVCDLECPHDILLGCTSLAQLSAWQDYTSRWLYMSRQTNHLHEQNTYIGKRDRFWTSSWPLVALETGD